MDVLGFFVFFALFLPGPPPETPVVVDVLFDMANPRASVAIMKDAILEEGDFYRNCRIISFEPDAVVARENETESTLKWLKEAGAKPRKGMRRKARHLFAVKQMAAIHEAQVHFLKKFDNGFSPDLQTLFDHQTLPGGFQDWQKQTYRYKIIQSGFKKKLAIEEKPTPFFIAIATPIRKGDYYFAVNELGEIRYSKKRSDVEWASVWDYRDPYPPTESVIR